MQQGKAEEVSEEMSHLAKQNYSTFYYLGRKSRDANENCVAPSFLSWANSHWWKAGWNDRDIELKPQ